MSRSGRAVLVVGAWAPTAWFDLAAALNAIPSPSPSIGGCDEVVSRGVDAGFIVEQARSSAKRGVSGPR